MLLEYLITSKVRRELLRTLWLLCDQGTTQALAEQSGVAYAPAYRELRKMVTLGLVVAETSGGATSFRANWDHPLANELRALVEAEDGVESETEMDVTGEAARVRAELMSLGAPLFGTPIDVEDVDRALVHGARLAQSDGTVASILPVCFWKQRDKINPKRLRRFAEKEGVGDQLRVLLAVTSEVSGDPRFARWAGKPPATRKGPRTYFFASDRRSNVSREVARKHTPAAAKQFGFWMNMGLDAFESMFQKHAGVA